LAAELGQTVVIEFHMWLMCASVASGQTTHRLSGIRGRPDEWRSGGVDEWQGGGVEEWRSGGVEEWRSGGVEW
jgi:hypothetical protein